MIVRDRRLDTIASTDGVQERVLVGVGDAVRRVCDQEGVLLRSEEPLVGISAGTIAAQEPMLTECPELACCRTPLSGEFRCALQLRFRIMVGPRDIGQECVQFGSSAYVLLRRGFGLRIGVDIAVIFAATGMSSVYMSANLTPSST